MSDFDLDRHLDDAMGVADGGEETPPTETPPTETPLEEAPAEESPASGMMDADGDDTQPASSADDGQQTQAETPPAEAPPASSLEPPKHWPLEKQEKFRGLPPEAQQILLEQASEIERGAQQKFQQAAEMRQEVAKILEQLALQKAGVQQPQQQQEAIEETPPEDPIERIKWEAKREALAEMEKLTQKREEEARLSAIERRAREIKAQVAQDPLKEHVMGALGGWLETFPQDIDPLDPYGRTYRQIEYDRLNQHPDYYYSKYRQAREMVVQTLEKQKDGNQAPPAQTATPAAPAGNQQQRQPKAQRQAPPPLEGGGNNLDQQAPVNNKAQKYLKLIKAGKAGPDTLEKYLDAIELNF